ncbi:MAG: hypothetical protein IPO60_13730 [Flavobacteriales bacterium]|jgi:hypothetical protein|nr:hypothetical protein [Flavobacteriales bacterium]MBK6893562.1 hypothetical protein [Flavobacteriales bacterium]MBK7248738.1 hypothetical protein [Flavobacteriales bacterium]MBK7287628.1 hypothetical protein [Flavobacteriales bacterium]MBK9059035.1 hypothetical protein [Flavobacteriales bacterium]
MSFKRRLLLFSFGIGLGCILAWAIFGSRLENTDWMPNYRVKLRLKNTLVKTTPEAEAMLAPLHLDLTDLRNAMDSCDIDFSDSKRSKDSLVYYVHGTVRGQQVHYMASTMRDFRTDSTATLVSIQAGGR